MIEKSCTKCGLTKPLTEFQSNMACRDGKRPDCKSCCSLLSRKYRDKNKDVLKKRKRTYYEFHKERIMEQHRDYIMRNEDAVFLRLQAYRSKNRKRISAWWSKSPRGMIGKGRQMALKRRPTDNAVTLDELMAMWSSQNGKCVVSGVTMTWGQGKTQPTSISIDRVDSALGYTKDNVRLICYQANSFKNRWSDQQMIAMAKSIVNHTNPEKMHWIESNSDDDRAWIH